MAVDLSFLPDQPQVRKRKPEGLDLSFLPDQPEPAAAPRAAAPAPKLDLSFLPDQPPAPGPTAEPRPSLVDRVATGLFGATEAAPALPVQNLPTFPPPERIVRTPAGELYERSLKAYQNGDQAEALALATKARAMEPGLIEAQRMIERINPVRATVRQVSTDTYNAALDAYLGNDQEKALQLAQKALIQDRRNTEALRMVERLTNAVGLTTPAPVTAPPPMPGREGQIIYPPVSTAGGVIRGLPRLALDTQVEGMKDIAAAGAYEGAGAVRGATFGYVDPTPLVEKVPMFRDAPINKGIAETAGGFAGAVAPMGLAVKGVELATAPIKAFQAVRPWLMGLFKAGAAGGLYGAARKPGENETRAMNAANDAATFMAWTGAFQGIGRIMNKTILVPDAKKAEIFETAKEAGLDAYTKGGTKADARDVFLKTLEDEADAAVKSVKAGTPGTSIQTPGYTEPATEVHVPTAFSRGLARLLERVRRPSISGARPNAQPFDVGFDAGGAEPLGGTSKPGPGTGGAPGPGFITFAGGGPKPLEVPIAPVRMLRPNFPIPSRFRIPQVDIRARAEMIHHDAMQEREAKLSPLEQFVVDNGGIAAYKMGANGKIEEAEEFKDVPVRLRAKKEVAKMKTNSADIIAQQAANANLLPVGASGDDLREAIKRFQKRGKIPRIQDFYQDARRELQNEYEQYGPPSRRQQQNFGTPEPQPFESRGEYKAGQPEKPIEAAGPRPALKVGPPWAKFAFWQDRAPYDTPVPMYNILGDHPQFGSTVGATTLESLKIKIPPTPKFEEWKAGGSKTSESGASYGMAPIIEFYHRAIKPLARGAKIALQSFRVGGLRPGIENLLGISEGPFVSSRVLKHIHEQRPRVADFIVEHMDELLDTMDIFRNYPDKPQDRFLLAKRMGRNFVTVLEVANQNGRGEIVSIYTARDEAIKKLEPLRIQVTGSGTTALGKETPFRPSGSAEAESIPPSGSPMSASGFSALQNQDSMLPPKPGEVKESGAQGQPLFEKRGEYGITQAEVDQNFGKTMDDMAVGKRAPTFPIPLGMTPDPMRLLGADHVPLVVSAEVIVKARTKHGIGVEALKQLPVRLRDPLMIFDSATQPNSLVALMDMTVGGKKVVAAVHLGKKAGRYDVNSIASVHGRNDTEVGLWIKKGLLRYWDRQKGTAWLQSARLQLPMEGVAPSAKRILEKTDIVNAPSGQKGPEGVAETQMGLFGGAEPGRAVTKKPKPVPAGQGTLFGGQAQPKFNVPKSAFTPEQIAQQTPAVQKLLATEEGKHQVPQDPLPRAIQESVIVKEMEEAGQMATHTMEIKAPEDVAAIFHHIKNNSVEKLYCLALDANNKIIAAQMVGMGVLDSAIANPRDFLKGAHAMGAKTVIPLHNHPSLDPRPSTEDRSLTRLLGEHAERVGMELPYHIVIDDDSFGYISRYGDVEIKPMVKTAPPSGFIPVKSFGQNFFGTGRTLVNTPEKAANLAFTLAGTKKAAVAIALDTKNKAVGVWHLGEKYPDNPKVLGRWLGEMLMRNNAAGIILASENLAESGYISEISRSVGSWGARLLDVVGWDGQNQSQVLTARGMGRVNESPAGVAEEEAPYLPRYTPPENAIEEAPKHRMEDTTEEGFYTDEPAVPADQGSDAFSRFLGVGKNSNKFPPPEMRTALLNPEGKFHDLGFWDEGTLSTLAPIRAVEIMDGKRYGMMKDNFLKPIQDADKTFQWELKEELKGIDEVFKGMSKAEKQTVFDVIEQKGSSTSIKVDNAVAYLKDKYETLLDRLNAVRAKIGKDPIKKRTNYITHFQEMSILQDIIRNFGFRVGNASVTDITDVPASMLAISDFTKANSPYFKFAKQRIGEMTERDAEKAYRIYIEPALRSIHMSRAIKNARDILEWKVVIASEYEGSDPTSVSAFAIRYPTAYRYFSRYLNRLTGKRDAWDKELPGLAFVAGFTNKLFSAGSIAGNVGTVFTQLASLRNTAAETGPWALKGQTLIMTPKWNRFYKTNSRIAMGRSYEPSYQNERYIGSKVVSGALDKISQAASVPVSMMDNLMVGGAFLSGYFQAKGAGYSEAEAIRHADDVAERTQASANLVDRPPANQGKIKTMMGQFQTFIFNEYSQWKYDFLKQAFKGEKTYQGYGQGLGGMKQGRSRGFERFMYYALGTLALGAIYEALGLPNPFKQEGATIPGGVDNSAASKVWQHVVNQIPYISSVRFGGSPAVKGVLQGMAYILGNEQQKKQALRKLASVGVRAFPMGGQISKTAGAWRLAADEKDTWKAFKLLAFGKYQAKQNAGKPDGNTRTVRTRTVSARNVRTRTVRTRVAR